MLPSFIVVGAAKAGTTGLYWYLAEHPAVFMSRVKETNYFAYGVDAHGKLLYGDPDVHRFPITTLGDYKNLFADAGSAGAVGEASPIYLECPQTAGRIHDTIPAARIICSLRQPVERAYSDYLMYLRRRGRSFDADREMNAQAIWARPDSRWMQVSRYYEQVRRYVDLFPREQILVLLFDDLRRNAPQVVSDVYRFVGVDPTFVPDLETRHAIGGMPSSKLLEGFFTNKTIISAVQPLIPKRAANWIRRLRSRNMRQAPALPAELKKQLTAHFADDIARTSDLIGRSLTHWL